MKRMMKRMLVNQGVIVVLFLMVRCYLLLVRIRHQGEEAWMEHLDNGGSVLLCAFHQAFFPAIRTFPNYRRYRPMVMISQSRDGELISTIAGFSGWRVARGSSSRGGKAAMEEMISVLENNGLAANLVDGPRGPAGVVKPGTIRMAQRAGAVIVPVVMVPSRAWKVSSWDRFLIPKPFSTAVIRFGPMIRADALETREDFERLRRRVESVMAPYLR